MKKYLKEIIILLIHLVMFYLFPLTCGPTDAMGMVLIIFVTSILLPFILTIISNNKIKSLPSEAFLFGGNNFLRYMFGGINYCLHK